jgi:hypothetical protein
LEAGRCDIYRLALAFQQLISALDINAVILEFNSTVVVITSIIKIAAIDK